LNSGIMPDSENKKYDVAISLRWTDVEHARALYDLLCDRLDVFFADERQADFVGTDGEESFGFIFRDQSRIVVVFYRSDWGSTTFTRAEEAAIKQRGYKDGYGFTVWVPMDEEKSIPPYIPPQQIWFDFDKYGVSGLAAVVEERVRDSGREVQSETIQEKLQRSTRRAELAGKRKVFENSQEAADFVAEASRQLERMITDRTQLYVEINPDVIFKTTSDQGKIAVDSWPFQAAFFFRGQAKNSARDVELHVHLNKIKDDVPFRSAWSAISKYSYKPTLDDAGEPTWSNSKSEFLSLEDLVVHILDQLAEKSFRVVEKRAAKW